MYFVEKACKVSDKPFKTWFSNNNNKALSGSQALEDYRAWDF